MYLISKMKNIILNTEEANEISTDRSSFKYYLNKPVILKEKETLSLQSVSRIEKTNEPVYDEGLVTIAGIEKDATSFSSLSFLTPSGHIPFQIEFDNTNICSVYNSQGGLSSGSGCIIIMHYWYSEGIHLEIGQVKETGKDYQAGDYVVLNKSAFPENLQISGDMELRLNITKVKNGIIKTQYGKGYVISTSSEFNSDPPTYSFLYNRYTYDVEIGQGLVITFRTSPITGAPIYIITTTYEELGYGYEVGDTIYIDKKLVRPYVESDTFSTPLKLIVQSVGDYPPDTTIYTYDNNTNYKISLSANNLLCDTNNIFKSDRNNDLLLIDKKIREEDDEVYKPINICNLEPQIIQSLDLKFNPVLDEASDFILHLKID